MHSLFIRYIGLHVIEQLSMLGRLREEVYRMEQTIKRLKMQVPHPPGSKVSFDYAGAYVPPGEGSRVSPAAPVSCAA